MQRRGYSDHLDGQVILISKRNEFIGGLVVTSCGSTLVSVQKEVVTLRAGRQLHEADRRRKQDWAGRRDPAAKNNALGYRVDGERTRLIFF